MNYLYVGLGAGLGGALRYWLSAVVYKIVPSYFPFGTLAVNILGSFILGVLIFGLDDKELLSPTLKLLLAIGFCGGFTTFSTFSLETVNLLRDSEFLFAGLNIILNVVVTITSIYLAYIIVK